MKITSTKPEVTQKVYEPATSSGYRPVELSAKWVFDNAHLLTQVQMARMFGIEVKTLMAHFSDEYELGVLWNGPYKRKKQLEMLIEQLSPSDTPDADGWTYNHRQEAAKTSDLLKALALYAKWYGGMDKPEVNVSIQNSPPEWSIEPPKFEQQTELTASEKAELEGEEE